MRPDILIFVLDPDVLDSDVLDPDVLILVLRPDVLDSDVLVWVLLQVTWSHHWSIVENLLCALNC